MDEEKKENSLSQEAMSNEELLVLSEELLGIPITRNAVAEKDAKLSEKRQHKQDRQKKYPDKLAFLLGLIILIFAVVGIVLTVWSGVRFLSSDSDSGNEYAAYNEYLTPIAAVDIDTFDDITAADREQLINAAIWSILSNESTPDTYSYSGGYLLIPEKDVASSFIAIFGPEAAQELTHMTVQGYNSTFEYDSANAVYKIPVTTISPIYTPQVTEVSRSGTSLLVTVNYMASESWAKDDEGNFVAPEPDKVMQITLRELQGSYYISAIQTVSSTVPETVTFENSKIEETSAEADETTTAKNQEKTTLGGRV